MNDKLITALVLIGLGAIVAGIALLSLPAGLMAFGAAALFIAVVLVKSVKGGEDDG